MSYPVPGALQCWRKKRERDLKWQGKKGDMERKRQIRAKGNIDRMETDRKSTSLEWHSLQDPVYIVLSVCVFICHFSISSSPHFFSFRFSWYFISQLLFSLRSSFSSTSGLLSLSSVLYFLHFFIFIYVITLMCEQLHQSFGTKWGDNETRLV